MEFSPDDATPNRFESGVASKVAKDHDIPLFPSYIASSFRAHLLPNKPSRNQNNLIVG